MAQYSHLPLYVKTYESVKIVYRIVKQFRKEYKYSLGAELQQIMWHILDEVIRTNSLQNLDKKVGIEKISQLFDKFKIRFRFAYEIGLISPDKFGKAQKEFDEIGRMVGGWSKWVDSQ